MATTTITRAKSSTKATKPINPMRVSKPKQAASPVTQPATTLSTPDKYLEPIFARINAAPITPFEKRTYAALLQVPRGHFTTYGALAAHLSSSPRAVGNAMRRNPLAPAVPCHRVVAAGGSLGGFKGSWPKEGRGITLEEKRKLLKGEGVKFDVEGNKVLGSPFVAFV